MKVNAVKNKILGVMIDAPGLHRKLASGLLLKDQDKDSSGIRPRWFKVYSVGEGIDWVNEGQYLFVAHGRWSNGVNVNEDLKLYLLDDKECLGVSDENPMDKLEN